MSKDSLSTCSNLLVLAPMEDYEVPEMPMLCESQPELLKKTPSRWKNKALVAAVGLSLLSTIPLSGCMGLHHGGAGMNPIYVAHLTETDAMELIRNQLEAVGLSFDSEVPLYTVEQHGGNRWGRNIGIDFFDEEKNIAITFINAHEDTTSATILDENLFGDWTTNHITNEFTENYPDIIFGVFYNPSRGREWRHRNRNRRHRNEEIEFLTENLESQIQAFIQQLQEQGIIE